jgi:ATPase family associated with various cellular activities (AAA)
MNLDLTFKQVCDLVQKDAKEEPKLLEAVDKLLGLALICSPLALGPAAVVLLPTLAVKNEVVKIGKSVFDWVAKKKDDDYLARQHHMQVAYGLLCFTAFFDALDQQMPKALRKRIGLLEGGKAFIATRASGKISELGSTLEDSCASTDLSNPLASVPVSFPHPTETLNEQLERHANLWKQMGQGFHGFIQNLAVWEQAKEDERTQILSAIDKIPEEAAKRFEAQYFELARKYPDFAVWANLQEHKKTKELIGELSQFVKLYAKLSKAGETSIDIGFTKLHAAVVDLPETLKISQATDLVESLKKHYHARIDDPIIEDKEEPEDDKPILSFPKVRDAFIPQSFRVIRQNGKARHLEDEEAWKGLPRRSDLGAFFVNYLSSPYSTESPLLILGHPGSGKSLLTTVLSSQLMSKHFTAIRVPLREVNAEAGIVSQIEERIRRITSISVDSWAKLSGDFKNNPPVVILDGYDELLQASGKVFSGYLKEVQNFQKNEAEQGRPVRVIVTSRVTLIDKATVPSGSTILRLLEFDKNQRERWISIWNKANVNYFMEAKIEEFALPDEKEGGAEKILALAEQPLLLLMLALYDSQDNQLRKSRVLDRTKLYDSLLRRFVTRERGKGNALTDATVSEKKKILDAEMQRLGVAALGMYNRRKVHILSPELNEDLKFFNSERPVAETSGKALSQADLLLGSFFFVHKSKAQHTAGAAEHHEETSAFEFLHNTFGEFLTADFILRRALNEVVALNALQQNEELRETLEKRLNDADGFQREWFASLVYTPLFSRPVVLEMMREWIRHVLKEKNLAKKSFINHLDTIVLNQIKRLLNKREMPSIIRKETAQEGYRAPFGDHPLLGHIAIYSINLILLRVIVSDEPFVFDESQIGTHEDGTRPWDRLTHIWRSWFALDNLKDLTAVMIAERTETLISVRTKERFQVMESDNRLETCLNVGISLADNISSGLAGLLLFDPFRPNQIDIDDLASRLGTEKISLDFEIIRKRLFRAEREIEDGKVDEYFDIFRQALEMSFHNERPEEVEHIILSLRRAIHRLKREDLRELRIASGRVFRNAIDPRTAHQVVMVSPQAGLVLLQVAKEVADTEWIRHFGRDLMEFTFRRDPIEMMEREPDSWIAWVRLVRELGIGHLREPHGRKFFHEFFERALDPRQLLDLSERNPEAALDWVRLMRELGGRRFLERFGPKSFHPEFFERALDPRYLLELSERNPEATLALVQLARELGGEHFIERYGKKLLHREFLERTLDPGYLLHLSERNPEAALALVQVARELGGKRFIERYEGKLLNSEFFQRALDPRYLLDLGERNPEAALASIQLARELGGAHVLENHGKKLFHPEFFERALDPRHLFRGADSSPAVVLEWLALILELGGERVMQRIGPEFFDSIFDAVTLAQFLQQKPAAFAVALRLSRIAKSPKATEAVIECLASSLRISGIKRSVLATLPIEALPDLRWLAEETGQPDLNAALTLLQGGEDTNE